MKTWLAKVLVRITQAFFREVLQMLMAWLLDAIRTHLQQHLQEMQATKRIMAAKARQEREQAEAAQNPAAAREAAIREARARRDADLMQRAAAAINNALEEVGAELPTAIDAAIATAANGRSRVVLRVASAKAGQRALGVHAAT